MFYPILFICYGHYFGNSFAIIWNLIMSIHLYWCSLFIYCNNVLDITFCSSFSVSFVAKAMHIRAFKESIQFPQFEFNTFQKVLIGMYNHQVFIKHIANHCLWNFRFFYICIKKLIDCSMKLIKNYRNVTSHIFN